MFINRSNEVNALNEVLSSSNAEFIIVHGRRRVGKTELLKNVQGNAVYFVGRQESPKDLIERFSKTIASSCEDDRLLRFPFRNWDEAWDYIENKTNIKIFFDEFPYMVESDPALPSILQEIWDHKLKATKVKLVFCGSSIGMMERHLFNRHAPLFGRRTFQLRVNPMRFADACEFFPKLNLEEKVRIFSAVGGTPAYLNEFGGGFDKGILGFLEKTQLLYSDALYILREELKEPRYYYAILEAVATGSTSLSQIMNSTGLSKDVTSKYLSVLRDLDIVQRVTPVTASSKFRKGLYKIKDNYFNFWFRFVFPNEDLIELGQRDLHLKQIAGDYPDYLGLVVEDIVKQILASEYPDHLIGTWWFKDTEIDVVGIDKGKKRMLCCEVKWRNRKIGVDVIKDLIDKSGRISGYEDYKKEYLIVSRSGFSKDAFAFISNIKERIILWTLEDLEKRMIATI